ncbi:hypothetical protein [Sphingomonas radiodurans]|uniref:hypothetical protein n=1 Tax=Sphingomonas radiodurans TaxID=2890321 RepID=UPI001E2ADC93|nr:hypothetical protein [Sphingomonas radiodurans]WBH17461.1 hypothetical protein LLW23_04970 [Sphingomonas radiodurans]
MADDATMYRARAAAETANANGATLDNVRERSERAAKAWETMADRAERVATQRHEREAATAAVRDAENNA